MFFPSHRINIVWIFSKIVTIFKRVVNYFISELNVPKDEKKTFRQSGLMIIHESRDPRVYNVKRGCTYSQGDSYKFHFVFISF